jgi:hypothetical protein
VTVYGQVSQKIGGNAGTIDPKAVLELESTTKGFLLPRMTAVQVAAITNPTSGMMVFCTDCGLASDGELRISYNGVWQTYKGNVTGNITGTAANVTGTVAVANGGTGAATATGALTNLGAAPIVSPTFTGTPSAPTATAGTNTTQVATTEFVTGAIATATIPDATTSAKGKIQLAGDLAGTAAVPTVPGLVLKAPIASPTFTGTPSAPTATAGTNTTQVATTEFVTGAIATATIPDATTSAKGKIQLSGDLAGTAAVPTVPGLALKAPIASPTFTGTVTAPIYASTPQALTYGPTINWNPTSGLNASVTLGGNGTLSFTSTPAVGSYGTLIVTQDASGNRSITLPTIPLAVNKVLGSASTTTIALSTAPNAKDILNFYYDGTNCFWNIGQGYGTAASAVITNLATGVSGTLPVANGGTGAATLTGLVKGNGTSAMTEAVAGTDYVIPSGSITGNAANVTGTVAIANGGTGQTSIAGVKSILGLTTTNVAIGSSSGTTSQGSGGVAVGNGTGQTNQGSQSVAIGYVAGNSNQGANSVAIGSNAAQSGQGTQSVAIGIAANSSANNATALGGYASAGHTNATAIGYQALTTANNTIQLGADGVSPVGSTAITNVKTTGTLTAGTVTYPNTHNSSAGQVLTVNAAGTASWAAASGGIPYTGATGAVNLGAYNLTVNEVTIGKGNGSLAENTVLGKSAMASVTGNNNTSIGSQTMPGLQSGAGNTAIGSAAGYSLGTGSNNIIMGYNANMSANPSNSIAIGTAIDVNTSNTIQIGNAQSSVFKTFAKLTTGSVTYPNTHNSTAGQVLTTDAAGVASWTAPSATAISGVLPVANGGTGLSSTPANGQIDIGNGAGFTRATLTAGSAITITNTAGAITIAAAVRPTTDQATATAGQTSFTLAQAPLNAKVWMFINGVRTNNNAYTISSTTVTYAPANNNGYVLVVGDRVQFDYCY